MTTQEWIDKYDINIKIKCSDKWRLSDCDKTEDDGIRRVIADVSVYAGDKLVVTVPYSWGSGFAFRWLSKKENQHLKGEIHPSWDTTPRLYKKDWERAEYDNKLMFVKMREDVVRAYKQAIEKDPSLVDLNEVIDNLQYIPQAVRYPFEYWCEMTGMDETLISSLNAYNESMKLGEKVFKLLGAKCSEEFADLI